jgi:hypothetical protein
MGHYSCALAGTFTVVKILKHGMLVRSEDLASVFDSIYRTLMIALRIAGF